MRATAKYPISMVRKQTLARHPLLELRASRLRGTLNWGDLMHRESEIIVSTITACKGARHSLHARPRQLDRSMSEVETSKQLLDEQFVRFAAVHPTLKVRQSTLYDF
jgi:hypothetical protein